MRTTRFFFMAAIIGLISLLFISAVFVGAASSLTGHWTAVDPLDADTVHMVLSGGNNGVYQLNAFDIHAPLVCVETSGLGQLKGTAIFDEGTGIITKTVVANCPSEGITYPENTLTMQYDSGTDTIYDSTFNLLFTR
jgi:hypothetical protein